jgi:hypothetical protein
MTTLQMTNWGRRQDPNSLILNEDILNRRKTYCVNLNRRKTYCVNRKCYRAGIRWVTNDVTLSIDTMARIGARASWVTAATSTLRFRFTPLTPDCDRQANQAQGVDPQGAMSFGSSPCRQKAA